MKHLFICGCPRSGTTALWQVISAHEHIAIGVERYLDKVYPNFSLTQRDFLKERFFNFSEAGTGAQFADHPHYVALEKRYLRAIYFGDKVPFLYVNFNAFFKSFPNAYVLFIIRNIYDVAQSYKVRLENEEDPWDRGVINAVEDWNLAIVNSLDALEAKKRLLIVEYERFFYDDASLEKLMNKIGLKISQAVSRKYQNMMILANRYESKRENTLSSEEKLHIQKEMDYYNYKKLLHYT